MLENFPLLQQRLGSNSCLPSAVTAILRYFDQEVSEEEVSEWCQEDADGCIIDLALDGLREREIDVTEITVDPENEIRRLVNDPDDPVPVLVMILPPFSQDLDHAVVVIGVDRDTSSGEIVSIMDPLTGSMRQVPAGTFFQQWDNAGQLAFLITS